MKYFVGTLLILAGVYTVLVAGYFANGEAGSSLDKGIPFLLLGLLVIAGGIVVIVRHARRGEDRLP